MGPSGLIRTTNLDKFGKWRGTRTRGRCLQCKTTLCLDGECFRIYHEFMKKK